jgi:hypothetical protein
MAKRDHIEQYRLLQKNLGRNIDTEEASKEFSRMYAFMRLIFAHEHKKRMQRYSELESTYRSNITNHNHYAKREKL